MHDVFPIHSEKSSEDFLLLAGSICSAGATNFTNYFASMEKKID